jgi:hypothetical protein
MKLRRQTVFLIPILLSSLCWAQGTTMSGSIKDKASKLPVEGARVTIAGNKAKADAVTDSEGEFVLSLAQGVKEGNTVVIQVEKAGYKPFRKYVAVSSEIPLQLSLEPIKPPKKTPVSQQESPERRNNISIDIGPSLDPKYAFETRFVLTNHNPLPMTNALYLCEIQNADHSMLNLAKPVTINFVASGPIEDLPTGMSRSLYCDFSAAPGVDSMDMPIVQIWVFYKCHNTEENKGFQFFAKRKFEDKTFVWLPGGAGKELGPPPNRPQ